MIKRLIFDVDNTLIMWKDEYDIAISDALDELNYPHTLELCEKINNLELDYEKGRKYFNRKELNDYINKYLTDKIPDNFVDMWIKQLSNCVPKRLDNEIYETLEYLYNRYELVILTNWFDESQIKRLEKVDIYKYFKEFYGAEKYAKPYKEAFLQATGKNNINECVMIGDNLESDIIAAQNIGMNQLVWLDNSNKENDNKENLKNIYVIKKLSDLKNIF